jgi:hypothetical protein
LMYALLMKYIYFGLLFIFLIIWPGIKQAAYLIKHSLINRHLGSL